MSCCGKQGGNVVPQANQMYHYTAPFKNAQWWSPIPDNCTRQREKECCQRKLYTPSKVNSCSSTFLPASANPDPYQCLSLCQGKNILKINQCQIEQAQKPRRISTNGCLMEPSVAEYTSAPMNSFCLKGACQSESILTNPKRFGPNPSQIWDKSTNFYDDMEIYGNPYTY